MSKISPVAGSSTSYQTSAKQTTHTLTKPSGVAAGDVMIASLASRIHTTVVTPPSGWNLIRRQNQGQTFNATYYKIAGASEPADYDWNFDIARNVAGGIVNITGVDTSNIVNASGGQNNASSTSVTAPSITTTFDATLLLYIGSHSNSGGGWTVPGGMTQEFTAESTEADTTDAGIILASETLSSSGSTGTRVGTLVTSRQNQGVAIALTGLDIQSFAGNISATSSLVAHLNEITAVNVKSSSIYEATTETTTHVINKPSGVVTGDLLFAVWSVRDVDISTWTEPSGWTRIDDSAQTGLDTAIYYKVAEASEPSAYTWIIGSSAIAAGIIMALQGDIKRVAPVDVSGETIVDGTGDGTMPSPSVNATDSRGFLIHAGGVKGTRSFTPPSGFTEVAEANPVTPFADVTSYIATKQLTEAGATGIITSTIGSGTPDTNAYTVVIETQTTDVLLSANVSATSSVTAPLELDTLRTSAVLNAFSSITAKISKSLHSASVFHGNIVLDLEAAYTAPSYDNISFNILRVDTDVGAALEILAIDAIYAASEIVVDSADEVSAIAADIFGSDVGSGIESIIVLSPISEDAVDLNISLSELSIADRQFMLRDAAQGSDGILYPLVASVLRSDQATGVEKILVALSSDHIGPVTDQAELSQVLADILYAEELKALEIEEKL